MRKLLIVLGVMVSVAVGTGTAKCQDVGTKADRAVLRAAVHVAAAGLGAVAVKEEGAYNEEMIRRFVDPIRFLQDESGYFFVYDYTNNMCIAHAAQKDFAGKDKSGYQDSRGMYVIRELSKIAKSDQHSGFLVYHWQNPNTKEEEQKLGYVEVIPGTTLYIGSGVYPSK